MMRFGFGYDVHRMVVNRKLILGGVDIPYFKGLLGHSDADVVCHAFADALLGAAALGDIGKHFPDTDPRFEEISSLVLLKHVVDLIRASNFEIINIDATVLLQQPKIAPYTKRMRENVAQALGIKIEQVSIKATTNEELGFIGMGEGAAAYAVASIQDNQIKLNL
ncbi:MAG: 2-C-methyl-D-erythritol 2,4-cyclodiphosphate synthase [Ignavibacteriae bacterium]|nr:2-C-methyl-D-erythritol 2,4-cyclodiphosphate synthase [Ignavibacteria bacterium]MBI3363694.1 2-C-methyl-D-erythritol 2,4-cyclodiphosphate synthase [Ignavibacteriota bacterium]